jgi:Ni/Co efflux regulator RcnB
MRLSLEKNTERKEVSQRGTSRKRTRGENNSLISNINSQIKTGIQRIKKGASVQYSFRMQMVEDWE